LTLLKSYRLIFLLLLIALVVCFVINISLGSVSIPIAEVVQVIFGGHAEKSSWDYIILDYRIPKAITSILTGSGLALSGLLMQTLFRNPLAGPFVLGISSGASLGVAFLILGASIFGGVLASFMVSNVTLAIAASIGSFLVLLIVMTVATRVRDTMAILIIGLMFGSITTAVVSVLSYFSNMEKLQAYVFWSFGSLGNLTWSQVSVYAFLFLAGTVLSISSIKGLNSLLLGENYARSVGLNIVRSRFIIILATSLLAGSATAFAGPIAFVGLAVPHLTRQIIPATNHAVLLPSVMLYGAIMMLLCDTIAQIPGSHLTLPINAVTSLVGAPVVIWLLIRKRKLNF